jgi:hypothetical protein
MSAVRVICLAAAVCLSTPVTPTLLALANEVIE